MTASQPASFVERHGAWLLFVLGLLLLLPANNLIPLLDRDEPRFARATVEMMDRDGWIVPYFNSDPAMSDAQRIAAMKAGAGAMSVGYRFDKPPMTYWLMRASYAIFGVNEFAARFHSVITGSLLASIVFLIGRRWLSARAGLIAGFGMLTCFQMAIHGRSAVADMPMVLFVTVAMFAMWELLQSFSWRNFATLYISLGLAFLAKGPIALIVPLLAALLWRFAFWRQPAPWKNLKLHLGVPVTLAIIGAWGIPALMQTQGMYWKTGIGEHVVGRGMKAFNGRIPFPLYYVFTAFVSLFPWCIFARPVWRAARSERTALNAYLVAWFLAPVLVFSFYATQLMHYILPGFPAFFLLLARALTRDEKLPRAFRPIAIAIPAALLTFAIGLGIWLRRETPAVQLREVFAQQKPATEFAWKNFTEPSLVFYAGHHWLNAANAAEFLSRPGPRLLLVEEKEVPPFGHKPPKDFSADLAGLPTNDCKHAVIAGTAVAKSFKRVTLHAFWKTE